MSCTRLSPDQVQLREDDNWPVFSVALQVERAQIYGVLPESI